MKKLIATLSLSLFTCLIGFAQCGGLYIAGAIDGPLSGGLPKAVQICASADVADMGIYGIGSANNGGGSDGEEFTFTAGEMMAAGDCFWIASEAVQFNAWFGFDPCYTSGAMGINGDDAIELFCSGAVTDVFGDINADGNGTCWEYLDGWATGQNTTLGTFDCADWTFSGPNAWDGDTAPGDPPYPSPAQTCPMAIPTVGQWALICMTLIFLSIGMVYIQDTELTELAA